MALEGMCAPKFLYSKIEICGSVNCCSSDYIQISSSLSHYPNFLVWSPSIINMESMINMELEMCIPMVKISKISYCFDYFDWDIDPYICSFNIFSTIIWVYCFRWPKLFYFIYSVQNRPSIVLLNCCLFIIWYIDNNKVGWMTKPKLYNYSPHLIRMWSLWIKQWCIYFLKKVIWSFNMIFKWTLRFHLSPIYLGTTIQKIDQ